MTVTGDQDQCQNRDQNLVQSVVGQFRMIQKNT